MKLVAVASGKGGVGKSTVSLVLARALAGRGRQVGLQGDVRSASSCRTLGVVDFSIFPHLEHPDLPWNTLAQAERWAADTSVPAYAIDDETAIKVVEGDVEVVSEGRWERFP